MPAKLLITLEFFPHKGGVANYLKYFALADEDIDILAPEINEKDIVDNSFNGNNNIYRQKLLSKSSILNVCKNSLLYHIP